MHLLTIVLKGLIGGFSVIAFALVGEAIHPRSVAGITSGAPAVAAAGLLVTVLAAGTVSAWNQALGMIVGSVALVVWCLVGVEAVKRLGGLKGSLAATSIWLVSAFTLWAVVLR